MTSINRANNAGSALPITTESTELTNLIESTNVDLKQIEQNEPEQPQTSKSVSSRTGEPKVTGRRAAVKVGGMVQQHALTSQLDAKKTGSQSGTKLSVGKDEAPPPAANATEKAADKVYDRIKSKIPDLKPIASGNYPELSKDEQMAADFGAGIAKYKEYVDYGKKALEKLKNMPNGPAKEAFKRALGDRLDQLSKFLDGTAAKLGKITKYAGIVKDAIGITDSVRELAGNVKNMDFRDPASVEKVMDSLGKANDKAQSVLGGITSTLATKGTTAAASGALVMAYAGIMVTAGIELGRAGVKAEKEYYDKFQQRMRIVDNGGVDPRQNVQLPNEPPPLKTYEQMRDEDRNFYHGVVENMVRKEFQEPRQQVKKEFDTAHKKVQDQFNNEEFPKMYLAKRGQILKELRAMRTEITSNYEMGTNPERVAMYNSIQRMINTLEEHERSDREGGASLTPGEIQNEIDMFRKDMFSPGPIKNMMNHLYSKELAKYYEQNGVGEGALEKAYEQAGVSKQVIEKMLAEKLKEAGL